MPPTAGKVGDFWFDTSAGVLKRWDGTAWIGDGPDKTDQVVATMPAIDEIKVYANYQGAVNGGQLPRTIRSEEHTSELQSLMRISYAVFCLKKKINPPSLTS